MAAADRPVRLADLAAVLGREVEGDDDTLVSGVAALERAGPGDIAFVRSPAYADLVAQTRAGALIVPAEVDPGARPAIRSPNPALDFARVVARIAPPARPVPGPHEHASVDATATVDASAAVGAGAIVGRDSAIGPRSVVHAGAVLYPEVRVGADCVVHGGVVLREGTRIGDRVVLEPGVVIGGEGFGFVTDERGARTRLPHLGRVVIEDDVEIGANTTVDRGTLGETRIRRGAKIDNLVQIAHNCDIGEDAIIVAQTGLSGSTRVGRGALIMAQAGSTGHLEVGEGAFVGARTGLHRDVAPGARVYGSPQQEERTWQRAMAALMHLPGALRRLRRVERTLALRGARGAEEERAGPGTGPGKRPGGDTD